MKNKYWFSALVFSVLFLSALSAQAGKTISMSVQLKIAEIRATPSFTGKVLAKLEYGTRVDTFETKDGWVRVKVPATGVQGWMSQSALTVKKIVMTGGGQTASGVNSSEVALAGKGFSKEVEAQYRADSKIDYTWVDKVETFTNPVEEVATFLEVGGLLAEAAK